METLLHYVWKHKLYAPDTFKTLDGQTLEIIDAGIHNTNAGPDFFNVKIKLNGKMWAGNVEIHTCTSDWYKHKHDTDKAYNSVILHVVETADLDEVYDQSKRKIPQWILKVPSHIQENYVYLLNQEQLIPCLTRAHEIPEIYWSDWKNALTSERLERKTEAIFQLLKDYQEDWNAVFYVTLARNFGFGINNDAFERLAKSLPYSCIAKHSNAPQQVEALFLGQAGLLEETLEDDYYLLLQREYLFLSKKYELQALDASIFKSLRIRPNNFPHIKIVQLAEFIGKRQNLFSQLLEKDDLKGFRSLFFSQVPEYWETHYHFEKTSPRHKKALGLSAIHIILINTVVPLLFAYGKHKDQEQYKQRALDLLEAIPPERNYIVNSFTRYGIKVQHAGDSQAFIQLKNEYCEAKKCIFCRIGHRLLCKK